MSLLTNLTHYWKFSEDSGSNVVDIVGGNNMTLSGTPAPAWQAGKLNNSVYFVTTGKGVFTGIATGTTFTYSAWLKPIATGATYASLFSQTNGGIFFKSDTRKINMYFSGDHLNNTALTLDVWTHVVFSVSAGAGTFYINGVADGTVASVPTGTYVNMGGDTASQYFKGNIDEVGLWSRALSPTEILQLYNNGNGLTYPFNSLTGISTLTGISSITL